MILVSIQNPRNCLSAGEYLNSPKSVQLIVASNILKSCNYFLLRAVGIVKEQSFHAFNICNRKKVYLLVIAVAQTQGAVVIFSPN